MPVRSLQKEAQAYIDSLRLQSKLAKDYDTAVAEYSDNVKLGVTPVLPEWKSVEEQRADVTKQRQIAFDHLKTIMDGNEARSTLDRLDDGDIWELNSNWNDVVTELKGRKNIDNVFFATFWDRYKQKRTATGDTGVTIPTQPSDLQDLYDTLVNRLKLEVDTLVEGYTFEQATVINHKLDGVVDTLTENFGTESDKIAAALKGITRALQKLGEKDTSYTEASVITEAINKAVSDMSPSVSEKTITQAIDRAVAQAVQASKERETQLEATLNALEAYRRANALQDTDIQQLKEMATSLFLDARTKKKEIERLNSLLKEAARKKTPFREVKQEIDERFGTPLATPVPGTPPPADYTPRTPVNLDNLLREELTSSAKKRERKKQKLTMDQIRTLDRATFIQKLDKDITGPQVKELAEEYKDQFGGTEEQWNKLNKAELANFYWTNKEGARYRTRGRKGTGVARCQLPRHGRRVVGRGVAPQSEEKYKQFGRYVIHIPSLKKGTLNIKYPSLASIPSIPQRFVSEDLTEFLLDLLEEGDMNNKLYQRLGDEDKTFFNRIAVAARINEKLNIKPNFENEREEMKRFELVRGEVISGQNSPEVLKELKQFTIKFLNEGRIPKQAGLDLLCAISCLS